MFSAFVYSEPFLARRQHHLNFYSNACFFYCAPHHIGIRCAEDDLYSTLFNKVAKEVLRDILVIDKK
jgi:hypothetical protein